jgi:8-oxo-dGTP diphosphatase
VPLYLIRHAAAGRRSSWKGDDADRPLSKRGKEQAASIADHLARSRVSHVLSSPAVRCVQTVTPLAKRAHREVISDKRMAEGARVRDALDVVLSAKNGTVICAHGDLIPAIMQHLADHGMKVLAPQRCQKGSIWEIQLRQGKPAKATYHPPS